MLSSCAASVCGVGHSLPRVNLWYASEAIGFTNNWLSLLFRDVDLPLLAYHMATMNIVCSRSHVALFVVIIVNFTRLSPTSLTLVSHVLDVSKQHP